MPVLQFWSKHLYFARVFSLFSPLFGDLHRSERSPSFHFWIGVHLTSLMGSFNLWIKVMRLPFNKAITSQIGSPQRQHRPVEPCNFDNTVIDYFSDYKIQFNWWNEQIMLLINCEIYDAVSASFDKVWQCKIRFYDWYFAPMVQPNAAIPSHV